MVPWNNAPAAAVVVPPKLFIVTSPTRAMLPTKFNWAPLAELSMIAVGMLGVPGGPAAGVVPVRLPPAPAAPAIVRAPFGF